MVENGLYDQSQRSDRIALLAIYMPLLRHEIFGFVRLWNIHTIRKQNNRPNSVTRQPWKLFHYPNSAEQCGITPNCTFLQTLQDDIKDWGMLIQILHFRTSGRILIFSRYR